MEPTLETTFERLRMALGRETTRPAKGAGVIALQRALPATEAHLAMLESLWRFDEPVSEAAPAR